MKFKAERAVPATITGYGPAGSTVRTKPGHTTSLLIGTSGLLQALGLRPLLTSNASTLQELAHNARGRGVSCWQPASACSFATPSWPQPLDATAHRRRNHGHPSGPAALTTFLAMEGRNVLAALVFRGSIGTPLVITYA